MIDPIAELNRLCSTARVLRDKADVLWRDFPVATFTPVRLMRDDLDARIADMEAVILADDESN